MTTEKSKHRPRSGRGRKMLPEGANGRAGCGLDHHGTQDDLADDAAAEAKRHKGGFQNASDN